MRVAWVVVGIVGLLSFGAGCSSSDGEPAGGLDCAWLASNNCWKTTISSAASCLPSTAESGVLSADSRTCTYASGAVIAFATPLVLPIPDEEDRSWDFTITNQGQTCLHFQESETAFSLTVGSQTVAESSFGALGLQIECPAGDRYSNSNAFDLLSCNADSGAFFGGLPGNAYTHSGSSITFSLLGGSDASSNGVQLFSCRK